MTVNLAIVVDSTFNTKSRLVGTFSTEQLHFLFRMQSGTVNDDHS